MPVRSCGERLVDVDAEGFLVDPSEWTPEIAAVLAREAGIEFLTSAHWRVIAFCREDAAREGATPGLRRISKLCGVGMKQLYELFPKGPGKLAALVAGLPKPQGCV